MFNKINRKVEYALIALKHIMHRAPGKLTSANEVSTTYGCPFDGVSRVMQVLASAGILKSEHGVSGGYLLIRDLSRVSLYDLFELILGPVEVAKCLAHGSESACEIRAQCNIVSPISLLNRRIVDFYKSLSVEDLLNARIPPTRLDATRNRQLSEVQRAAGAAAVEAGAGWQDE